MGNKRGKNSTTGGVLIINIRNINSEQTKPHSKFYENKTTSWKLISKTNFLNLRREMEIFFSPRKESNYPTKTVYYIYLK